MDKEKIKMLFSYILVIGMVIGFASLTSNLSINGVANVKSNSWNIFFDNIVVTSGSVTASTPTIVNKTTVNYGATFNKPGDFYEFTVDAVNEGTIDAVIDSITMTNISQNFIKYSVTYEDGRNVLEGDILEAESVNTYKIHVEFDRDITEEDLSSTDISANLSFSVNYSQSHEQQLTKTEVGTVWEKSYLGKEEEFTVPDTGIYKLEVWGAQGGTTYGGYGGYSTGFVTLNKNSTLYINVGGQGGNASTRTGGYNGGGTGGTGAGYANGSGGGGATHIATKSGLLSTLSEDIDSVLIVAGGGGGTCGNGWSSYRGGSGGGIQGILGSVYGTHNNEVGGQQKTSRNIFGKGTNGRNAPSFASNGAEGNGGGGGGFYGGVASTSTGYGSNAAGPGGSGYIGNSDLSKKVMYCYNCTTSNVDSTKTISTTSVSGNAVSNYAKTGNGYAKITYYGRSGIYFDNEKVSTGSASINHLKILNNKISFTPTLNNTTDYVEFSFDVVNNMNTGMYLSKIKQNTYDSSKIKYEITYSDGEKVKVKDYLSPNATESIVVKVRLLDENITLQNQLYYINLEFSNAKNNEIYSRLKWTMTYTGEGQVFQVPYDGNYKIELWGASSGSNGGYVRGTINLEENNNLYVYVGERGERKKTSATFNGGGSSTKGTYESYGDNYVQNINGSGATDIRLINGNWNSDIGLNSRIMVAGAGSSGGAAGGLVSYQTYPNSNTSKSQYYSTGATQISSGTSNFNSNLNGNFGIGGNGENNAYGYGSQGGSGGYYGGAGRIASDWNGSGTRYEPGGATGGSSFISGHVGCIAITSQSDRTPKEGCVNNPLSNNCSHHYSDYIFTDTKMIDGKGFSWTSEIGSQEQMPNPTGGYYDLGKGHSGNGYARITYLGE